MSKVNIARVEAMWGVFIADALAMPVHWFYKPLDIKRLCGDWIRGFIRPPAQHPTCILTISAVDSSGRNSGSEGRPVIGNVILHDKLKFWQCGDRTVHYHQGMAAGDNTLNSQCAVRIMDVLSSEDPERTKPARDLQLYVFEKYVAFMTTPGTHNDTYAESWHRALFREWADLDAPPKTGSDIVKFLEERSQRMINGSPDSQLLGIGALVCAIPWVVHYAAAEEDRASRAAVDFVRLTHPAKGLDWFVELYARSLHKVINGQPVKEVSRAALTSEPLGMASADVDLLVAAVEGLQRGSEAELKQYQDIVAQLGMACYIKGALSSMFFLAHQFADDFKAGVLMNVNVGGENCHRGSALGALLGAATAYQPSNPVPEALKTGLHSIAAEWGRVRAAL